MSTPEATPGPVPADPLLPPVAPPLASSDAKPVTETRPEILVGAAFAGGLILAKLLGRVRG